MGKSEKILGKILGGLSDANFSFQDLCYLLIRLGFDQRVKGSHHIFSKVGVDEIINLQPKGTLSKPYQIKQVREVILKYQLGEITGE